MERLPACSGNKSLSEPMPGSRGRRAPASCVPWARTHVGAGVLCAPCSQAGAQDLTRHRHPAGRVTVHQPGLLYPVFPGRIRILWLRGGIYIPCPVPCVPGEGEYLYPVFSIRVGCVWGVESISGVPVFRGDL